MYALIVKKEPERYELQHKLTMEAEPYQVEVAADPNILKRSLTVDWEPGKENVLWIAKFG
ncbi:hypothetical protein [Bacillus infantis]|uniref:hypothetical protein n=1 Tax=Bacillus infantis TaxID=324767 RepID=UPI00209C77CB|nr:hypothetical protein [Bacillus infantis]MCP1159365.1 hypothetical protein [Bacillus infantis]